MSAPDRPMPLAIAGAEELPVYPLRAGTRVGALDYFPLFHTRLLGSSMFATATNEEIGAALALWAYAVGTQDPGGTLPLADLDLAHAARCWRDMATWGRLRTSVLRGWTRVRVIDEAEETVAIRLAHPVVTEAAVEMSRIVAGAQARRQGNLARQKFGRLRATMRDLGHEHLARDDEAVRRVQEWLAERGLPQTKPDVRSAMQRIFNVIT